MNFRRLRTGEWLAAIGGIILPVALFQPWYEDGSRSRTAFDAFRVLDVLLTATAIAAVAYWLLTVSRRSPSLPLAAGVTALLLALLGVIGVAYHLIDVPDGGPGTSLGAGAWLGLAAVLATLAGAWIALRNESRPEVDPPVPVEVRPAPCVAPGTPVEPRA